MRADSAIEISVVLRVPADPVVVELSDVLIELRGQHGLRSLEDTAQATARTILPGRPADLNFRQNNRSLISIYEDIGKLNHYWVGLGLAGQPKFLSRNPRA